MGMEAELFNQVLQRVDYSHPANFTKYLDLTS